MRRAAGSLSVAERLEDHGHQVGSDGAVPREHSLDPHQELVQRRVLGEDPSDICMQSGDQEALISALAEEDHRHRRGQPCQAGGQLERRQRL